MQSSVNASKWVFWAQVSGHLFLLQRVSCEVSCLTPLCILQVPLAGPHTTSEAQAFFHMYHSYSEITNPSDCMRWCRYSLGLLQKEVAAMVGMEEWLYQDLESGAFHRSFTPELADKLAALYDKYDGFGNLRSLQVTGIAAMVEPFSEEYNAHAAFKKIPLDALKKLPSPMNLICVTPTRIDALFSDFKKDGYSVRQVLHQLA